MKEPKVRRRIRYMCLRIVRRLKEIRERKGPQYHSLTQDYRRPRYTWFGRIPPKRPAL